MVGLKKAARQIRKSKTIVISGHVNPDGDSMGSLLSLGLGLKKAGKTVHMISSDGVPYRYRRLPGASQIIRRIMQPVDMAIAVDCSSREILGANYDSFITARRIMEIDHHEFRRPFGNISLVDKKAACVGEMIYTLLKNLGVRITGGIAQNLMTSIIVETDSFRLPKVRPFTFEVSTELIRTGIDFYGLVDTVFWSKRKESVILTGTCLSRCRFLAGGRLVWSIVTNEDFAKHNGRDEDVDSAPDEMRAIKSVQVALLFREKDKNTLRVSLRSKDMINVASLAELYGGGGHFDVAGCNISNDKKSIDEVLRLARMLIEKRNMTR